MTAEITFEMFLIVELTFEMLYADAQGPGEQTGNSEMWNCHPTGCKN